MLHITAKKFKELHSYKYHQSYNVAHQSQSSTKELQFYQGYMLTFKELQCYIKATKLH